MIPAVLLLLGTFTLGLPACRLALALARKFQLIDVPNLRSSHTRPTPRGGGMGILMAMAPGAAVGWALHLAGGVETNAAAGTALAVLILFSVGYLDDRFGVRPLVKLPLQILAAAVVLHGVGVFEYVHLPEWGPVRLSVLAGPLTFFWLAGFSNAYNFMDGIDGIAGLHAGIAALFFAVAAEVNGGAGVQWLALPLAGSCLAFLTVNWSPARLFMGDAGSLPVGFLLALLALLGHRFAGVPFVTSFLILGPFLFDATYTILRRIVRRENLARAHRSHLYQRLVIAGWSHGSVTVLYGAWTVLTGGLGLLYGSGTTGVRAAVLVTALVSGLGVIQMVRRTERRKGEIASG